MRTRDGAQRQVDGASQLSRRIVARSSDQDVRPAVAVEVFDARNYRGCVTFCLAQQRRIRVAERAASGDRAVDEVDRSCPLQWPAGTSDIVARHSDQEIVQPVPIRVACWRKAHSCMILFFFAQEKGIGLVEVHPSHGRIAAAAAPIAILVHAVAADLLGVRVDAGIAVVAVRAVVAPARWPLAGLAHALRIAEAVPIRVLVPDERVDGVILVRFAVAVVVRPVAALLSRGVDFGIAFIAIPALGHVAAGRLAAEQLVLGISEAVAIAVRIPGGRIRQVLLLVDQAITVVVLVVAAFDRPRPGLVVQIVAVQAQGRVRMVLVRGLAGHDRLLVAAEAVAVAVGGPGHGVVGLVLVRAAVAVVVDAVAELEHAGVDGRVVVVAVGAGGVAVEVEVLVAGGLDGAAREGQDGDQVARRAQNPRPSTGLRPRRYGGTWQTVTSKLHSTPG